MKLSKTKKARYMREYRFKKKILRWLILRDIVVAALDRL